MKLNPTLFKSGLIPLLVLINAGTCWAAASLSPSSQSITGVAGSTVTSKTITGTGFTGAITYTVATALPNGLSINNSTGVISGIPSIAQKSTSYTIAASDGTATASTKVSIAVNPALAPSSQSINIVLGNSLTTTALTGAGFVTAPSFSVSPGLVNGLSLNTATGVISGNPASTLATTTYTITGSDGTFKATAQTKITVSPPPPAISPASQTIDGISRGTTVNGVFTGTNVNTTPFSASNFGGSVSYSITPALPDGLSINPTTGVISGIAKVPKLAAGYTIIAKGATSGNATATLYLNITDNCIPETLDSASEGRRAYLRLNCQSCHGDSGLGGMGPKIIGQNNVGERVTIGSSSRGMPAFKDYICGNDIKNMNTYLYNLEHGPTPPSFKHWWEANPSQ